MGFLSRIVSGVRAQASIASAAPRVAASRQAPAGGEAPDVELVFGATREPAPPARGLAPSAPAAHASVEQTGLRPAAPREEAMPPSAAFAVTRRDHDAVLDMPPHDPADRAAALAVPQVSLPAPDADARSADVAALLPSLAGLRTASPVGAGRGSVDETGPDEAIARPAAGAPARPRVEVPTVAVAIGTERGGDREGRDRPVRDAALDADAATSSARGQPGPAAAPHSEAPGPPEAVMQAALERALAARSEAIVPSPSIEAASSRRDVEPRRPERPSPAHAAAERVAPRVHIGRLEVIVVAPSPSRAPGGSPQRGPADVTSRRYLRKA